MPTLNYIPRVFSNAERQARHNTNALALGLTLAAHTTLPANCVFIQYHHYTADYRTTREKPFVVYSRNTGTSHYRASYKTLESAANAARAIQARISEVTASLEILG
jgi:hypothetical protein